ncbi:DNA-dependent DNA polymerase family X [Fadolivirus algeromassiliense]|jgi:DNA polymerase/3'-5' exonuclease PolX|uniref:DNA-directed DNA polymerase n=1 Tax=Fadolivirus FV1/VV64 TaxID=3070911 RepID=A0A7D3QU29_9VIRU|nr:DNA-dependent DNA polymerase family X [Fadolivirus algeromassiliense]QKF93827.1 DNA-dependent DNA polymerase family X [Fadolivirus FV1/VV64]
MSKKKNDIIDIEVANIKNEKIVNEFEKLIQQIKIQIDIAPSTSQYMTNHFRLKQINNALSIIKKYPKEIKSGSDLKDIKGIGKGTISRIDEILKSGKLSEIKIKDSDKKYSDYVKELEMIHGIGHAKAYELVTKHNIKTISELKKAYNDGTIELSNLIVTGLKYHDIYQEKIPRAEVTKIYDYLEKIAKLIDKDLSVTICGSYRRLKPTSNDIDVLLAHPKIKTKLQITNNEDTNYLFKFIKELKEKKFILDDLTDKDYHIKYMGYCKFKKNKHEYPVRRIDIRYIPFDSYPVAMLYFTGNANFNKRMRALAEQLGYMLNEYGLYRLNGEKKTRIKITSEKDVFDKLGMEYLPPEKRE